MAIKATIQIDDDRWAKHPYSVVFDDEKCNEECAAYNLNSRAQCANAINNARSLGYDVDYSVDEKHF